ncbi:hypothetical protein [Kitasatospora sp. NPDC127116]|uniref:hypothetical protein n=1 Tax=Kitasatospora sp. NPDC127116 TaxID=3345367 RepID=UPI003377B171
MPAAPAPRTCRPTPCDVLLRGRSGTSCGRTPWPAVGGRARRRAACRRPVTPTGESPDDREQGLLGDVRHRVRLRAAGTSPRAIAQALAAARRIQRTAYRHTDAGEEAALHAATARDEWQRIHDHVAATASALYDPDDDPELQRALRRERHRREIAARAREAAGPDRLTDGDHRPSATAPPAPSARPCCCTGSCRTGS